MPRTRKSAARAAAAISGADIMISKVLDGDKENAHARSTDAADSNSSRCVKIVVTCRRILIAFRGSSEKKRKSIGRRVSFSSTVDVRCFDKGKLFAYRFPASQSNSKGAVLHKLTAYFYLDREQWKNSPKKKKSRGKNDKHVGDES